MRQQGHLLITPLLEIVWCSGMVSCALNGRDQPVLHAGNYGNLPLVLVPSLLRESTIFDGVSQETAFAYVVIGLFVFSIAQFSLAFQLLKLPPTAAAAADSVTPLPALPRAVSPKSGMQRSEHGTPRAGEPLDGVDAPDCSPTCCECKQRVCECRVLEDAAPGDADLELATCSESSNERACSAQAHAAVCGTCGLHGGAHPRSHADGCSAASCPGCAPQCCCDWGRRSTHACAVQLLSEHSARERRAGDKVGAADAEKAADDACVRKFPEGEGCEAQQYGCRSQEGGAVCMHCGRDLTPLKCVHRASWRHAQRAWFRDLGFNESKRYIRLKVRGSDARMRLLMGMGAQHRLR